jgi:predicted alpha/beta superfamily hydrolase
MFVLALALCAQPLIADEQTEQLKARGLSDDMIARLRTDSLYPIRGSVEPPRLVRAKGWAWDHEVRIYLPPGYHLTEEEYPTLWVTDNSLESVQAALTGDSMGLAPELIVVAVGAPANVNPAEHQRRRTYDFIPDKATMGAAFAQVPEDMIGGAPGFLEFLVNQLRPMLAREYRMDLEDQGYAGHSGGAQFGLYVLLTRPESFNKYIISSPAMYQPWLDLEERWHKDNKDLNANVFLSAGEAEASHPMWSGAQIVSTVATLSERLVGRRYPSLQLTVKIFPDEDHVSVIPVAYTRGIRVLWGSLSKYRIQSP